jgi:hypothetical protein
VISMLEEQQKRFVSADKLSVQNCKLLL